MKSNEEFLEEAKRKIKTVIRYMGLYAAGVWLSVILGYWLSDWFFVIWWVLWGFPLALALCVAVYAEVTGHSNLDRFQIEEVGDDDVTLR